MKLILSFLFTLLAVVSLSANSTPSGNARRENWHPPKEYKVTSSSTLNIRSNNNKDATVVGTFRVGEIINLYGFIEDWGIVKINGTDCYVSMNFLEPYEYRPSKSNTGSRSIDYSFLLYIIAGLFLLQFIWGIIDEIPSFLLYFNILALPILTIIYSRVASYPMWFCHPSIVGWWLTILNVFILILYCGFFWGMIKECFSGVLGIFKGEFGFGIICLAVLLLYIKAGSDLIGMAFDELMIVGVIMVLGSIPSSNFVGSFTDRDGNRWNVYEK